MKKLLTLLALVSISSGALASGGFGLDSSLIDDLQKQTITVKAKQQREKRAAWDQLREECKDHPSCIYRELKQRYH
ncbi:hypothetical protein VIN01S_17610 [Vibrio inusitatus NBRC 102082]|uniref:Uncharacterized protein n=1 Tax=Vibrio inusitatus NBRC 102082 TaxID=1219070 RepID=A0A4Y3HV75_9VIBR|nr:hypothetical protein [Vibrio inusitatus]GEA50957.1 hypothetical protein VIN01S_17610 [Vibrio inusitatus NBRC 102082]